MVTLFWSGKALILEQYIPRDSTLDRGAYCDLFENHLKPIIGSKHRDLLISSLFLKHSNTHSHKTGYKLRLKCLPHPTYSTEIAPYDYQVFRPIREALCGKKFSMNEEIKGPYIAVYNVGQKFFSVQECRRQGSGVDHVVRTLLKTKTEFLSYLYTLFKL